MNFSISSTTDAGTKKKINQDRLFVQKFETRIGNIAFAVLCDGLGGYEFGEAASAELIRAFEGWMCESLSYLSERQAEDHFIREQWNRIIQMENDKIRSFGKQNGCKVGTTITALLLTEVRYFLLNIGDTRAYRIGESVEQLTEDHTMVARELKLGNITKEQAEHAPMRNVLTKCVGVEEHVYPDLFFGAVQKNLVYMLCSDGFRHCITEKELQEHLYMYRKKDPLGMKKQEEYLVALNKQRGETDNISVITIYTS